MERVLWLRDYFWVKPTTDLWTAKTRVFSFCHFPTFCVCFFLRLNDCVLQPCKHRDQRPEFVRSGPAFFRPPHPGTQNDRQRPPAREPRVPERPRASPHLRPCGCRGPRCGSRARPVRTPSAARGRLCCAPAEAQHGRQEPADAPPRAHAEREQQQREPERRGHRHRQRPPAPAPPAPQAPQQPRRQRQQQPHGPRAAHADDRAAHADDGHAAPTPPQQRALPQEQHRVRVGRNGGNRRAGGRAGAGRAAPQALDDERHGAPPAARGRRQHRQRAAEPVAPRGAAAAAVAARPRRAPVLREHRLVRQPHVLGRLPGRLPAPAPCVTIVPALFIVVVVILFIFVVLFFRGRKKRTTYAQDAQDAGAREDVCVAVGPVVAAEEQEAAGLRAWCGCRGSRDGCS